MKYLFIIPALLIFVSCSSPESEAEDLLEGIWVTHSHYDEGGKDIWVFKNGMVKSELEKYIDLPYNIVGDTLYIRVSTIDDMYSDDIWIIKTLTATNFEFEGGRHGLIGRKIDEAEKLEIEKNAGTGGGMTYEETMGEY